MFTEQLLLDEMETEIHKTDVRFPNTRATRHIHAMIPELSATDLAREWGLLPYRNARSLAAWMASGSWGGWGRRNVRLKQGVYKKEAALRGSGEGDLGLCGGTESSEHAQDKAGWWAF